MQQAQLRFYGAYDPSFLFRKVDLLYAAYKHRPEFRRFVAEMGGTEDSTNDQSFTGLAAEMYCSTFQQFESLFALLVAVFQPLPHWVFLTRYRTQEIVVKIQAFAGGAFAEATSGACVSARDFAAKTVYAGVPEVRENPLYERTLDDIGWFLANMAARYLAGRGEYNAYKHGLRVLAGDGATLAIDTGAGTGNFQPIISMGHSVSFLEIEDRPEDYVAKEVTKEIDAEDSFHAMYIMCEIAKTTCKIRLAALRGEPIEIPAWTIDREGIARLRPVSSFSFPL
jgi:hypothetical protein